MQRLRIAIVLKQGGHTRVFDVVQQVAQPEMEILDRFGVEVLDILRFAVSDYRRFD